MNTIKDSEVWVVEYNRPDFYDCNRVCSTKEIAFGSVLADYMRMSIKVPEKTPRWKELKCLWYNEESAMFEFILEDETSNLKETIKCFIYRTYIL